jgi:hypothetical protein
MDNELHTEKWNNLLIKILTAAALLGTACFAIYSFRERTIIEINHRQLTAGNIRLKQQIEMIKLSDNNLQKEKAILNTAQIYHSITENANQYQIRIKGFTPERDNHNLLITLLGTYPKAISFFGEIYQDKLGILKKIEIKKYAGEPNTSVEILVTLTTAPEGGVPR